MSKRTSLTDIADDNQASDIGDNVSVSDNPLFSSVVTAVIDSANPNIAASASIHDPAPPDSTIISTSSFSNADGELTNRLKPYGIGIDIHRDFGEACILVRCDSSIFKFTCEFQTTWPELRQFKTWCIDTIQDNSSPPVTITSDADLFYCIESTACYHLPVIMALGGRPAIVNPSIAGASKRKTDKLDSLMLSVHCLTAIWPESYILSSSKHALRLLLAERNYTKTNCNRIGNRINNALLRFGFTLGRDGSLTKSHSLREIVEDQLSDRPTQAIPNLPPEGLPKSIRELLKSSYAEYDYYYERKADLEKVILSSVNDMEWETRSGSLSGKKMLELLTTAPGVGTWTAIEWLAYIVTPNRFPNSKAVAAYCGLDPSLKISAKHVVSTTRRGGNKHLHSSLTNAASRLMGRRDEPFGKWGYNIYCQTGRWKKGTNAVGRKIAVALFYMQMRGETFSYSKYHLLSEKDVIDISIVDLACLNTDFKRYIRPLAAIDCKTTKDLVSRYNNCELKKIKGLGKKFYALINYFINNQKEYETKYETLIANRKNASPSISKSENNGEQ